MLDTPLSVSTTHKPGDSYVQSFARGLEVIRSFNASAPQQTLSEVAARTGLTRAGARRILLTLQTLGYLESDGRLFRLTPRILDLGFAYLSSTPIWDLAEPMMEALTERVHESCSAAVLDGLDIVYVLRIHTHKIMSTNLAVGSRLPAFWTSMGRVLLAALNPAEARHVLEAAPRPARTEHTVTDIYALMALIEEVRRQGFAMIDQEVEVGLRSIAVPLATARGHVVAALNVGHAAGAESMAALKERFMPPLMKVKAELADVLV